MIDIDAETLVPLKSAGVLVPGRNGRGVSYETLRRWWKQGLSGSKLETVKIGGIRHTTAAALRRFIGNLNAQEDVVSQKQLSERAKAALKALKDEFGV